MLRRCSCNQGSDFHAGPCHVYTNNPRGLCSMCISLCRDEGKEETVEKATKSQNGEESLVQGLLGKTAREELENCPRYISGQSTLGKEDYKWVEARAREEVETSATDLELMIFKLVPVARVVRAASVLRISRGRRRKKRP